MEKFQELRDSAGKKIQIADYVLTMTYPLIKDPKLLLSVAENLFLAYSYSISSLLHYERLFKRIPSFQDDFSSKLDLFIDRCLGKYGIDSENIKIIRDLREIIVAHRKSPVEFPRKDSFVICDSNYRLRTISPSILKDYVGKGLRSKCRLPSICEHHSNKKHATRGTCPLWGMSPLPFTVNASRWQPEYFARF